MRLIAGLAALLLAAASWGATRWTEDCTVILLGLPFHPELEITKLVIVACLFYLGFEEFQAQRLPSGACCLALAYLFQPLWPHLQRVPLKTWSRIDLLTGVVMIVWSCCGLGFTDLRKLLCKRVVAPVFIASKRRRAAIYVTAALCFYFWGRSQQSCLDADLDYPHSVLTNQWLSWMTTEAWPSQDIPSDWVVYRDGKNGFQTYFPQTPDVIDGDGYTSAYFKYPDCPVTLEVNRMVAKTEEVDSGGALAIQVEALQSIGSVVLECEEGKADLRPRGQVMARLEEFWLDDLLQPRTTHRYTRVLSRSDDLYLDETEYLVGNVTFVVRVTAFAHRENGLRTGYLDGGNGFALDSDRRRDLYVFRAASFALLPQK